MSDVNKTQMVAPPMADPNKTVMGFAPTVNATQTIKPVQCPVCKAFNPVGVRFCVDCGLVLDQVLDGDVFGAPRVEMPVLIDSAGRSYTLRPGENVIGRQGDIAVDDGRMSRRHALIVVEAGGAITLSELGSTNGTKVNGQAVQPGMPATLSTGAELSLGGWTCTLSLPSQADKTQMPMLGKTVGISAAPSTSTAPAFLVFDSERRPLKDGENTFGRRDGNDLVIPDPYISGKHGVIEIVSGEAFLTDIGSSNGTLVNEVKVPANMRTKIGPNDVIRLGALELRVEFPGV
jgi:pSer/pThr/pTyr-binding forkhead associated (FHA) protein